MIILKKVSSSEEEEEQKQENRKNSDELDDISLIERMEKTSVKKVCVRHFSCNFHSSIAVAENNQVFIWGRSMQSVLYDPVEELRQERVLLSPKYIPSMEIAVQVVLIPASRFRQ